jgi:hypothetical protein
MMILLLTKRARPTKQGYVYDNVKTSTEGYQEPLKAKTK